MSNKEPLTEENGTTEFSGFNGISQFLDGPVVKKFDEKVEKLFDKIRNQPLADRIFYTAAQLGDHALIWQLIAALKALFGNEKHGRNFFRLSSSLAFESILVNGVLKSMFPRERPDVDNDERPLYLRQPATTSFPSGHASAAALSVLLLKTSKKKSPFSMITLILAGIVATSRIYVKIHHASDVVAGASVGYGLGKIIKALWRK